MHECHRSSSPNKEQKIQKQKNNKNFGNHSKNIMTPWQSALLIALLLDKNCFHSFSSGFLQTPSIWKQSFCFLTVISGGVIVFTEADIPIISQVLLFHPRGDQHIISVSKWEELTLLHFLDLLLEPQCLSLMFPDLQMRQSRVFSHNSCKLDARKAIEKGRWYHLSCKGISQIDSPTFNLLFSPPVN